MSIINDALKKTQTKLNEQKPHVQDQRINPQEKRIGLWVMTVFIFIGFLGCTAVLFFLISSRNKQLASTPVSVNGQTNSPEAKTPLFTAPQKQTTSSAQANPTTTLVLNGIITMGHDQLALINNQIYKEGDYIEGRRILSITPEKVEIFDKDKVIVLTTK